MSLRDEIRAKLNKPQSGGWKPLIQDKPEALSHIVDILAAAVAEGKVMPAKLAALEDVMTGKQHITDMDLNLLLRRFSCKS